MEGKASLEYIPIKLGNEQECTICAFYFVPFVFVKSLILAQDERWRRG